MSVRRLVPDALGVAWIVVLAAAYLAPALSHGASLGPFDVLSQYGLTASAPAHVHNLVGSDEIEALIPWQLLDWVEVHAGHLPLWNPYSALGTPLAFNLQSSPFGLSVAAGYLFPLDLAHTATIVVRLLLAGTGAYVFLRVLRTSVPAAALGATTFELSGGFSVWLGSNVTDIMSYLGWAFALVVLIGRAPHHRRYVVALSAVVALALYGGEPQSAVALLGSLAVFALVSGALHARSAGWRPVLRPLRWTAFAVLTGCGLAAPLYLPAAGLAPGSVRSGYPELGGLPAYDLTHLVFSTYNGSPLNGAVVIGPDNLYVSMLYVGVIGAGLALLAVLAHVRRPEVAGLAAIALLLGVVLFLTPLLDVVRALPGGPEVRLYVVGTPLDFSLACLAGLGGDVLLGRSAARFRRRALAAIGALALVVLGLGIALWAGAGHLGAPAERTRLESFVWPGICLLVLAGVAATAGARWAGRRPLRGAATGALLVTQGAFLVAAGAPILSSSSHFFPVTPGIAELKRDVGSRLVGLGVCPSINSFPSIGILPDDNLAYGVAEFADYDPILPRAYYASYGDAVGVKELVVSPGLYCPPISSADLARRFGVSYILEPPATPGPTGTRSIGRVGGEGLYEVPGAARATYRALAPGSGRLVGRTTTVAYAQPSPGTWEMSLDPRKPSMLLLRLTAVPGWRASIDGRPLRTDVWDGVMLEAAVPPGRHVVVVSYWPRSLDLGLAIGLCSLVALLAVALGDRRRTRERP